MTTPSGTISLNDVNVELGFAGTTLISMNQTSVRTLAGVPSGTITMQNLQGKSNRVTANVTLSSDTANYTLNTAKASGYVAGKTDMTLTINAGVTVYSASTGSYALTVDTSWAAGDTVTIVNNGIILGRGGDGGQGGYNQNPYTNGIAGSAGGGALNVQRATSINNANRIAGGGGGGGGGKMGVWVIGKNSGGVGAGGGGGGIGNSSGGAGGSTATQASGSSGSSGTLTSAGGGGSGGQYAGTIGGTGGTGGSYGSSGSQGGASSYPGGAGAGGGSAGAAVVGNSNITWIATGTRNGSIS